MAKFSKNSEESLNNLEFHSLFEQRLTNIQEHLDKLDIRMDKIDDKLDKIVNMVSNNDAAVQVLKNRVDTLETRLRDKEQIISELSNKVYYISTIISGIGAVAGYFASFLLK
jgi:archaellum component FlaC